MVNVNWLFGLFVDDKRLQKVIYRQLSTLKVRCQNSKLEFPISEFQSESERACLSRFGKSFKF